MTAPQTHLIADDLAIRVGRFTAVWAALEIDLDAIIWRLLHVDPAAG